MTQQRTFREHGMPQFGRDLVWGAAALFLYGVVGQLFVRQTSLMPSAVINSTLFLQWFGIPVQLFRGIMTAVFAFYMVRALRAFELENRRRFEEANQARLRAQTIALEAERRISREMEHLNEELRLKAHELLFLLDLSNLLASSLSLQDRLHRVLEKIVHNLNLFDAGIILLVRREAMGLHAWASTGFLLSDDSGEEPARYVSALELGEQCVARALAICKHLDGKIFEFSLDDALEQKACRQYDSPTVAISFPLTARQQVTGSLVLARPQAAEGNLTFEEFKLIVGIAQQLGLSIENARLHQEAQKREKILGELLHQVVEAQEAERQRIARELHDATGQSLTAIALGLRGIETLLANDSPAVAEQVRELKLFGTDALGELRQLIADLRPPQLDDLGLVAALRWYIQTFEKRTSLQVDFVVKGGYARLPSEYETVLFRITQEALTNIVKHADASQVAVTIEMNPAQICMVIEDDGRGFDPGAVLGEEGPQTGWGLLGIQERALLLGGQHEIVSAPERGTYIRVSVPLIMETEDVEDTAATG
jgi:signal transduction histidine kinase